MWCSPLRPHTALAIVGSIKNTFNKQYWLPYAAQTPQEQLGLYCHLVGTRFEGFHEEKEGATHQRRWDEEQEKTTLWMLA